MSKIKDSIFENLDEPDNTWRGYKELIMRGCMIDHLTIYPAPHNGIEVKLTFKNNKFAEENALGLMEGVVSDIKKETVGSENRLTFMTDERGIIKVIEELSGDKPKGRNDSYFAVIKPEIATAIIANEVEVLGKKPSELGLATFKVLHVDGERQRDYGLEQPISYLGDYKIKYAHSQILEVREDGQVAEGNNFEISTTLFLTKQGQKKAAEILKDAGIKYQEHAHELKLAPLHPDTMDYSIKIEGKTADQVMAALKGHDNLIPSFFVKEIADKALELHPEQQAINARISESGKAWLAAVVETKRSCESNAFNALS